MYINCMLRESIENSVLLLMQRRCCKNESYRVGKSGGRAVETRILGLMDKKKQAVSGIYSKKVCKATKKNTRSSKTDTRSTVGSSYGRTYRLIGSAQVGRYINGYIGGFTGTTGPKKQY